MTRPTLGSVYSVNEYYRDVRFLKFRGTISQLSEMRFQGFGIPFRSPRLPPGGKIWAPGGLVGENLAPRSSGELDRASGRPRGRPREASCILPRGKKWIWPKREHKFGRPVRQEVCVAGRWLLAKHELPTTNSYGLRPGAPTNLGVRFFPTAQRGC